MKTTNTITIELLKERIEKAKKSDIKTIRKMAEFTERIMKHNKK